jgi:hypothetical protein
MATLLHVMICYHHHTPNAELDRRFDTTQSLAAMTVPFRISFSRTFGEVRVRESQSRKVTISSIEGTVDRIFVFASDSTRLNGTEHDDFIVYYQVLISGEIDGNTRQLLTSNSPTSLKERESVIEQTAAGHNALLFSTDTEFKGHSAWISEEVLDGYSGTIACISASYFYAWILALRIERNQLLQDITPKIRAGDKTVREIIEQRMRLLNLERYFLLKDRTNERVLWDVCVKLSEKYRLDERYQRASARHTAFENHINNTSRALQSQRAASLTNMVFLLTVLSVPLAAMQVLFGINLDGAIYQKTKEIFFYKTTYAVLGVAVAVVMFPMFAVTFFDLIRGKNRK